MSLRGAGRGWAWQRGVGGLTARRHGEDIECKPLIKVDNSWQYPVPSTQSQYPCSGSSSREAGARRTSAAASSFPAHSSSSGFLTWTLNGYCVSVSTVFIINYYYYYYYYFYLARLIFVKLQFEL